VYTLCPSPNLPSPSPLPGSIYIINLYHLAMFLF
jgi:hypothetical protein